MRPEQTILFSDLDGTLFNSEGRLSPENRAAIERYIAAGGAFALSTGRTPPNLLRYIGDLPTNAPSIVLNGAAVCDLRTLEYAFCAHLDRAGVDPVLRWALEQIPGVDIQLYTEEDIIYCTPEATANPAYLELHRPVKFLTLDALGDRPLIKALLLPPPEHYGALEEGLRRFGEDQFLPVPGTAAVGECFRYYELMPRGANKGAALARLRSHPALAGRAVLAAGDYWNDYELLQEADVPVCPANAIDEIKAICKFVTVACDDHAIARVIDEIIPQL